MRRWVHDFVPVHGKFWWPVMLMHYSPVKRSLKLARWCKRWPQFRDRLRAALAALAAFAALATTVAALATLDPHAPATTATVTTIASFAALSIAE